MLNDGTTFKRVMLGLASVVITITGASAQAVEPERAPATTQAVDPAADAELLAALRTVFTMLEEEKDPDPVFQQYAARFPEARIGTERGTSTWQTLSFNRLGAGVDAFRFRTPPDARTTLRWVFVFSNADLDSWYILPVTGKMKGFRNFRLGKAKDFEPYADTDTRALFYQELSADSLKPDTEYIIWMRFYHERPVEMDIALNLLTKPTPSVVEDLGLVRKKK